MRSNENHATVTASDLWAAAGARCNYAVIDGVPYIGISGDTGLGHIVPVPAPIWFSHIEGEGNQNNVFRAVVAHATRVGQGAFKAEKNPDRSHAIAGVLSVIEGTYSPKRDMTNDIVQSEIDRRFELKIRAAISEAGIVNPTDKAVADTVKDVAGSDRGKEVLSELLAEVKSELTYEPSRKGGGAGGKIAVSI